MCFSKWFTFYRGREEHQQAVDTLKRLIEIAPETTEAHYLLALSHLSLKQPNDALSAFLETIRLRPDDVAAHYHAALLFEQQGEIDNAIVHYEKTIALDTTLIESDIGRNLQTPMPGVKATEVEPFFRLGAIYRHRNDEDNILRVYQPALEIEPEHPELHHLLAVIFEKRDERGMQDGLASYALEAIRYYGLANHYNPDNFDWHYSYARLLDRHAETLGEDLSQTRRDGCYGIHQNDCPEPRLRGCLLLSWDAHASLSADWQNALSLQPNLRGFQTGSTLSTQTSRGKL